MILDEEWKDEFLTLVENLEAHGKIEYVEQPMQHQEFLLAL